MTSTLQNILVIDDTPVASERVQRLLPHVNVIAAYNGANGLDYARTLEHLDLVVLDVHMPHNGIRVARQLREISRTLRILPFSDDASKAGVLREIGCAPLIPKSINDRSLLTAIHQAAMMKIEPLPSSAIMDHYHTESAEAEQEFRQSLAFSIALLASSRSFLSLLECALIDARAIVVTKATNARVIEPFLPTLAPKMLVADAGIQSAAQALSQAHQIPLLIVGMSLADTFSAIVGQPDALIFDVTNANNVHGALHALAQKQIYRDPVLSRVLTGHGLVQAHQDLLPFLLRGWSPEEITKHIRLTKETIRNYKMAIYRSFQVEDIGALRDRINELLVEQ